MAVADEIGSIAEVRKALIPNNAGTRLVFTEEMENALGIYCYDRASDKTTFLVERPDKQDGWRTKALAWSPDDSRIACVKEGMEPREEIILFDGSSGAIMGNAAAPGFYIESSFAWLSNHSFVYSTTNSLVIIEQQSDGLWRQAQVCDVAMEAQFACFTATSSHSVAWRTRRGKADDFWTYDIFSQSLRKLDLVVTNAMDNLNYSVETGEYLVKCGDDEGSYLFRCQTNDGRGTTGRPGGTHVLPSRPPVGETETIALPEHSYDVELIKEEGQNCFYIKTGPNGKPLRWVWPGMITEWELAGGNLFFKGNPETEPTGLWRFDIASGTSHRVVSGLKRPFKYANFVTPALASATDAERHRFYYHLWHPAPSFTEGKHPLILSDGIHYWAGQPQVAANAGYYFAVADRVFWYDIEGWPARVMALYRVLSTRPDIDTNRVYLYAACAEVSALKEVLSRNHGLFKGAIMWSPDQFPPLDDPRFSDIFANMEIDNTNGLQHLTEYQDKAASAGLSVKVAVPKARHTPNTVASERETIYQFAQFLQEH